MSDTFIGGLKALMGAVASPRITAALAAIFGVFWLFASGPMTELGLPSAVHSLIGIFSLALLAAWAVQVAANLWGAVNTAWRVWRRRRKAIRYLDTLSPREKELMVNCVRTDQQSVQVPRHTGPGPSLEAKGIFFAAKVGHTMNMSFIIDDHVWKYLQKNRDTVLDLWGR